MISWAVSELVVTYGELSFLYYIYIKPDTIKRKVTFICMFKLIKLS